ncbi:MAG TPA: substrate-binding domain-containing protein [Candidatus Acidoferrum sp.]|nr:substrate-binding domain-containing protein [Candidatus Acidoferrum sp.]
MLRFGRAVLCALLGTTLLFGARHLGASAKAEPAPLKIGFLLDSLEVERWQTDTQAFQKRAKELGAEVLLETANGNDDVQYQQAQKLLNQGVKSLVIVPHDTDRAVQIVDLAKSRGVPVVSYDRLIRNSKIDFFVGVDSEKIGEIQAQSLVKLAPKGNYVLMEGSPTDSNARLLREGQEKVLQPYVDRGDIKIVGDVWCADWDPLEAYAKMAELIAADHGNITAVVASNDGTAGGAVQALQDAKLAGKVLISGQDADLAAIIRLLKGTQTMTVYKPLSAQAIQAANVAVSLANGKTPPTEQSISVGKKNVPAFLDSVVVVTKDNVMQTVIKDGFQNLDTIKKSLPPDEWPK